jgi:hypothetical protein
MQDKKAGSEMKNRHYWFKTIVTEDTSVMLLETSTL